MSSFSIFKKKQPEATSVADALAGTAGIPSAKSKKRKSESRNSEAEDEQLVPERKRARRRLIGAIAMVLAVIIGLPMVLDSEPKTSGKNIVIQIPSKDAPSVSVGSKDGVAQAGASPQSSKAISPSLDIEPAPSSASLTSTAPVGNVEGIELTTTATKVDTKDKSESVAKKEAPAKTKDAESKSVDQTVEQRPRNPDESTRAMAILDGKDATKNAVAKPGAVPLPSASSKTPTRIVVQIGAFATQEKINELKGKLESAGIKYYTQKVATSSGDKVRVRIGPFSDKESAEQVKKKLEKIGLTGSLITL